MKPHAQDDTNGWQLRVFPDREASEERGDWTRYAGDAGHPDQDMYYNAATGEKRLLSERDSAQQGVIFTYCT